MIYSKIFVPIFSMFYKGCSGHMKASLWVILVLSSVVCTAKRNDTLMQNSFRLEIAGKSLYGAGITFERGWRNEMNGKHSSAFNSIDVNAGYAGYKFIVTSIGINRNWYLSNDRKLFMGCGVAVALLICPDPTPKSLREFYDSINFYGDEYINPVEPWILGNIYMRYNFKRLFVQAGFLPQLFYDRAYNTGIHFGPWGGLSIGVNLKSKT